MSDDLVKIRELATAATPGPWHVFNYDCGDRDWYDHNGPCPSIQAPDDKDCAIVHWDGFKQQYWSSANGDQKKIEANAAFIAAANPATVIRMCDDILALRVALYQRDAEIERLREAATVVLNAEDQWNRDKDKAAFDALGASLDGLRAAQQETKA